MLGGIMLGIEAAVGGAVAAAGATPSAASKAASATLTSFSDGIMPRAPAGPAAKSWD